MKLNRTILTVISASFLFAVCVACGSSGDSTGSSSTVETPEADDGLTAVPNSQGLRARVPEGVTPNGIGGAAGFHTDDRSFSMRVREDTSNTTVATARETAQLMAFVRFVQNEETPDGFVLTYESHTMDDQGNPTQDSIFPVQIKRNVGTTSYLCEGSANTEENLARVVEACQSLTGG